MYILVAILSYSAFPFFCLHAKTFYVLYSTDILVNF